MTSGTKLRPSTHASQPLSQRMCDHPNWPSSASTSTPGSMWAEGANPGSGRVHASSPPGGTRCVARPVQAVELTFLP